MALVIGENSKGELIVQLPSGIIINKSTGETYTAEQLDEVFGDASTPATTTPSTSATTNPPSTVPKVTVNGGNGKTYYVDPNVINEYVGTLDDLLQTLTLSEDELRDQFKTEFPDVMQDYVFEKYEIQALLDDLSTLKTNITNYKEWLSTTLKEIQDSDEIRSQQYGDGGLAGSGGGSGGGGSTGGGSQTPTVTTPRYTTPSTVAPLPTQPKTQPQTQPTTPQLQPVTQPQTQAPQTQPQIQPQTQPQLQPVTQPQTQPSTLPSGAPTIAPTIAPTVAPSSTSLVSPAVSATVSPSGQPLGSDSDSNSQDKTKSLLSDSFKDMLEAGASFGNRSPVGGIASIGAKDGLMSSGTMAGLALAAGGASLGAGLLIKNKTKKYRFTPEDFESQTEQTRQTILKDFQQVGASDEEIELFTSSDFEISQSTFDEHIKKVEKAYENNINIVQELFDSYGFDIIENEQVNKYLLFVAMLIDGSCNTGEKNIYSILNQSLEEKDIDFIYSGLNMHEYIDAQEDDEEEDTSEYEEYQVDGDSLNDQSIDSWLEENGILE